LRYVAPGEWGKLMGLDRIPEVRTLRQKITQLCSEQGLAERWSSGAGISDPQGQPRQMGSIWNWPNAVSDSLTIYG
jgi:hypothetical protein